MLTFEMMCDAVEAVEAQADRPTPPLVLPAWFPVEYLDLADQWARDNGWTGVCRVGEQQPRTDAQ